MNSSGWTPSRGLCAIVGAVEQGDGVDEHRAAHEGHDEVPEPAAAATVRVRRRRCRLGRERPRSTVRSRRHRRTAASPIASTKPTATGVNELRPPDTIAAHHEVSTIRPDASPTPSDLAGRRVGAEQPDEARDPHAEEQADRADQQSLADRQPDGAVGDRDRKLGKHGPDYTVGRPMVTGTR